MSYKNATIALATILGATYILLLVFTFAFIMPQLKLGSSMNTAVQHAADNDTLCDTVPCDFVPDASVQPPSNQEVAAAGGTKQYNVTSSKFAAQAVAVLEDAVLNKNALQPLPNTRVLRVFSGTAQEDKEKDKLQNMAWLLQPAASGGKQLWLAFRGTQTSEEWKIDWDMEQVPLFTNKEQADVLVHRGFLKAIEELMPDIVATLRPLVGADKDTHIFVTGHSLGASLATLCTLLLAMQGFRNLHTYIYAPPRSGNDLFVRLVMSLLQSGELKEFHAIANVADLIPQVPLSVMPNVKKPAEPMLYAQFPLLMFQDNWGSWIHNHIMPVYIANLDRVSPVAVNLGSKKPLRPFKKPTKARVPPGFTHSLAKKILFTA
jgi:hypothetical protein